MTKIVKLMGSIKPHRKFNVAFYPWQNPLELKLRMTSWKTLNVISQKRFKLNLNDNYKWENSSKLRKKLWKTVNKTLDLETLLRFQILQLMFKEKSQKLILMQNHCYHRILQVHFPLKNKSISIIKWIGTQCKNFSLFRVRL